MSDQNASEPQEPAVEAVDGSDAPTVAIEDLDQALRSIERERARVRPEDWQTLFRQLQTMLEDLVKQPFLVGDLEAEARLDAILMASDLPDLDAKVDHLAEYISGKLAYMAALSEAEGGVQTPADVPYLAPTQSNAAVVARVASSQGPSGSDFDLGGDADSAPETPSTGRRNVIRL